MVRRKLNLVCILVVIGMFSPAAMALDLLGPPMAGLDQGQYSTGAEFSYTNMDVEVSGPFAPGTLLGDAVIDMQVQKYLARLGYGVASDWELYGLFGLTEADMDADPGGEDFNGDADFIYGIGTKKTLSEDGNTTWGAVLQYTRGRSSDSFKRSATFGSNAISVNTAYRMELNWYDIMLAAGPTVEENDQFSWYCGPFLHFLEGDIEVKGATGFAEYELEQKLELGAFLGGVIQLAQGISANIEGQITIDDAWLVGGGILIKH